MFEILQTNAQITIQNLGKQASVDGSRTFYGGALDRYALILANRLLHNSDHSPTLEFIDELQLQFKQSTWVALCGASYTAHIEDRPLWNGWRTKINSGERLTIKGPLQGVYGYLAIKGGISNYHIDKVNSKCLHVNDKLALNPTNECFCKPAGVVQKTNDGIIRVLAGSDLNQFTPTSRKLFWSNNWLLAKTDRIAAKLVGEPLFTESKTAFRPKHIKPGMVQVSPNGQMFISLADTKNTAKNAVIAWVIEADLWKVAQTNLEQILTFQHVSPNQVESANYEWQQYFERLARMLGRNK